MVLRDRRSLDTGSTWVGVFLTSLLWTTPGTTEVIGHRGHWVSYEEVFGAQEESVLTTESLWSPRDLSGEVGTRPSSRVSFRQRPDTRHRPNRSRTTQVTQFVLDVGRLTESRTLETTLILHINLLESVRINPLKKSGFGFFKNLWKVFRYGRRFKRKQSLGRDLPCDRKKLRKQWSVLSLDEDGTFPETPVPVYSSVSSKMNSLVRWLFNPLTKLREWYGLW